ncbi:ABC transporter transmembrane domain-containing protein [Synechococcus sp. MIT S9507]|uniref:ABC transporter transmembrane domain-containing protein n=1 Tax=Synechococcus sp. MIT S9507 TaxID=3082544 RepID=UPI0039B6B122
MTTTPIAALQQHPAFRGLSQDGLDKVNQSAKLLRYRIGQTITDASTLPANVVFLVNGQARLLGREKGQLVTLAKMGSGFAVGLASLLRGLACEEVSASTESTALAIPDQCIADLYRNEESFRTWCQRSLWPAELAALIQAIQQRSAQSDGSLLRWLKALSEQSKLLEHTDQARQQAETDGLNVYALDHTNPTKHGVAINPGDPLPPGMSPFKPRLIAVPQVLAEAIAGEGTASAVNPEILEESKQELLTLENAPDRPAASGLHQSGNPGSGKFRLVRGQGPLQETMACFQMMAAVMNLPFRRDSIEKVLRDVVRRDQKPNLQICGQLAAGLGLHVVAARVPASESTRLKTPSLMQWDGGFVLVIGSSSNGLLLASPRDGEITVTPEQISDRFPEGFEILLVDRSHSTPDQTFGFTWFLPVLRRYRGVLAQVFVASFVVQLFGLANPLLIQVIIDKVINQRSLDTLQVLGVALVAVTLLEGVLGSLKTFLFAETTNRIDQRLGAEVIDHLLRLPLGYFDRRPVGELGTRIAELEKIRNFLTGQALTTILDALFSVIYIVVMALYSWVLTLVALAVLPIQVGLTLLGAPLFRRQFRQAAEENAKTQSHLVEVLTGVQTVKAQNVEMVSRWKWQELYSRYIARTYEKTITGTAVTQASQVLQKLSQLLVLWVGASMVLKGELTLGQLIAFRIISGYVTQPLLRLSTIWQNIQELKVSFERLADIINTPLESSETDQAKIPLPPINGKVTFDDVTFSFSPSAPPVLKNISVSIEANSFVGIVGQSGSGKSTLVKLLPRLYAPNSGRLLVDEYDIDKVELYSLRRQIGIVPQDPLLFSGTISENIALTQPDADSDDIVEAARMAGAHEFIMQLSSGYSTNVGERGSNLSGGQRQRIAIARTLLSKPKLLVMDEATSALDYDTERRVCNNLLESINNSTVLFITHRLSSIRRADRILMMHNGALVESGTHQELMDLKGRYFALYRQQEAS